MTRPRSTEETSQAEVIAFLADPLTYAGVGEVERIETHGNLIFLAGAEAWKIKRAVCFPYMDFSTLQKREAACAREVAINRRTAPEIYLGSVPVTRCGDGTLALGGSGKVVEWTVHMRRFEQSALLSNIAAAGGISRDLAMAVADVVYESHHSAERARCFSAAAQMRELVRSVCRSLAGAQAFRHQDVVQFSRLAEAHLARAAPILDERARFGAVRHCHGDLHLANIVLWREHPLLYDAIEFDEAIATIDVLYDLAFLLMDLDWHGQASAASMIFNRYLWRSHNELDLRGLRALPLFLALRAGVRAMVSADRACQQQGAAAGQDRERAGKYLQAARHYLASSAPALIAIGGLSGTGKSTLGTALAARIGPAPGAVHLRSDLERKALFGVGETVRLPSAAYSRASADAVYATVCGKARLVLGAGHAVIADAVYQTPAQRSAIQSAAESAGVPFRGIWLAAEPETLSARVARRRNDASDATAEIIARQLALDMGQLSPAWTHLDASGCPAETLSLALSALGIGSPQAATSAGGGKAP